MGVCISACADPKPQRQVAYHETSPNSAIENELKQIETNTRSSPIVEQQQIKAIQQIQKKQNLLETKDNLTLPSQNNQTIQNDQPQHTIKSTTLKNQNKSRFYQTKSDQKSLTDSIKDKQNNQDFQLAQKTQKQQIVNIERRSLKKSKKSKKQLQVFSDKNVAQSKRKTEQEFFLLQKHKIYNLKLTPIDQKNNNLFKNTLTFTKTTKSQQILFQNNIKYSGSWLMGKFHGEGILTIQDQYIYQGFFKEGYFHGEGRINFQNGESYDGNWSSNKANGQGVFEYISERIFRGNWKDNKQQGFGVQQWCSGQKFEGNWVNGKKDGYGQFYFDDGSYYKGHFNNNQIHGQGKYYYAQQKTYEGMWQHNQKCGYGVMTWQQTNIRYQGQFCKDKMNGKGKLIDEDGTKYQGNFENGKRQGIIMQTKVDGSVRKSQWYYGKLIRYMDAERSRRSMLNESNSNSISIEN